MGVRFVGRVLAAVGFVALAGTAAAQQGRISGKVTDAAGNAVAAATVQAIEGLRTVAVVSTEADGSYRLSGLKTSTYGVKVTRIGYKPYSKYGIAASASGATLNVTLEDMPTQLNAVAITGIAEEEKVTKAPAAIQVLNQQTINETVTATPVEQLRTVPGIDITAGGIVQTNVVARGFNNIFSGSLLTLTDNRFNFVPSLRVNIGYMQPTTNEDVERIEVVLGPAAALYGPNASQGVMHIITKSPFNSKGGTATLDVGERNFMRIAGRYAGTVGEKFGYKISAEKLTATDFPSVDSVELAAGRQRSFDIEKTSMDLRADFRPDKKTEITANFGRTNVGSAVEPTGLGAGQVKDWAFSAYQLRMRRGKLFAQVFMNQSDAGKTFLLRTGQPIVDKSDQKVAQIQHAIDLFGGKQTFVYGADYLKTEPKTEGTINGRYENTDNFVEAGGYVHSVTHLNKYWDAVAALRYDKQDKLKDPTWSPRVALVYSPSENQSFRFSFNQAFSNPSTNNQSLDLVAGYVPDQATNWYRVRALGVPQDGLSFRRDCTGVGAPGNLCMQAPTQFNPNGGFVPASASLFYPAAFAVVSAKGLATSVAGGLAAAGVPAALVPTVRDLVMNTLGGLHPTAAQVGTVLRTLNPTTGLFSDVQAGDVRDIAQIKPTLSTGYELGWKGQIGKKFYGTVDWWYSEKKDFVGPLIVETPNVFLDASTLGTYLATNLATALTPVVGPTTAGAIAAGLAPNIAAGMGGVKNSKAAPGVPLGVVTPNNPLGTSADIILTYRNFGKLNINGWDLSGTYMLDDAWSLYGTYSWVSNDFFPKAKVGGVSDIALNAPAKKSSMTLRYRDDAAGANGEIRFRHQARFPGNSGVYVGPVNPYNLFDASFTFRPNFLGGAMFSVMATNLLDFKHQEFVGGAPLGRMVISRIQYAF